MIRKLKQSDMPRVLEYVCQDAAYNIFIIGDIETFGMETDFQRVYGEFDLADNLLSVFLRYRENAIYYSHDQRFNLGYLDIFNQDPFIYISGKTSLMQLIEPYLEGFTKKHTYFCKTDVLNVPHINDKNIKVLSTTKDAEKLYDLLSAIDEFGYSRKDKSSFIEQKTSDKSMGITLMIEDGDHVISSVATTAETTKNAMVVAVATHPLERNHGYASLLMEALMDIYINQKKKELCLFYDNPKAGSIYHRLGFKTIGTWDMYQKQN